MALERLTSTPAKKKNSSIQLFSKFSVYKRLSISKDLKQTKKFWICCYGNWLLGFKCKTVLFYRPKNMDKEISYVSDFCASISRGSWSVLNEMIFLMNFSWSCGAWSHFRDKKDTFFCIWSLKKKISAFKWKSSPFKTHIILI